MEKTLWCQFQSEALREIIAHGCVKRKIVFTTLKAGENPQKISALTAKKKMQQLYVALLLYKIIFVDRNT
ncbi:3-dehydroquinate synthase [Trichinella pseudospiralis]